MKLIELTEEEIQAALNLLDAAVRAQGLNAAQNALALAQKLQNAPQAEEYNPEGPLPE
jgi:hypothetical protein